METAKAYTPTIGRVLLAAIFLISGVGKLLNPAGALGYINSVGLPLPELALVIAIVVEIGGGLLLIAGYRTRIVALALAVFTIVAGIFFHSHFADQNQLIHFLKNLAIAGGLLEVAAFGAGRFSLDARRSVTA